MQIIVHRGTHRIGGCITEIRTTKTRLIVDMGSLLPGAEFVENAVFEIDGVTRGEPDCDAVLITHYHGDHVGLVDTVLPGIPIYMGAVAKQIYSTVQRTLRKKLNQGYPDLVSEFETFHAGRPIYVKDVKITPYAIDHSAFDAYMFLIEAEGKRILHTGDFRMHGARGQSMPAVFAKFARDIDVLVTEGTMLSRPGEKVFSEYELGRRAAEIMRDQKYVFALCSSTNIDTIAEFYHAAIDNKRLFIVCEDDFQAEILRIVTSNALSSFYRFDRKKVYIYGENLRALMSEQGFCFLGRTNRTTHKALAAFPDNVLIYSLWSGYLDRDHPAYDEYKGAFVDQARTGGSRFEYLHTSGHASADELKKLCALTGAKTIVPIHCEKPEAFLELGLAAEIKILSDGEVFEIRR